MSRTWCFVLVFSAVLGGTQLVNLVANGKPRGSFSASSDGVSAPEAVADKVETKPPAPDRTECPVPRQASAAVISPSVRAKDSAPVALTPRDPRQEIIYLYKTGKLFRKDQYASVRSAFASDFAQKHTHDIRLGFREDYDRIMAWLGQRRDLREDLFTALDERYDNLPNAFAVFRELWLWSAEKVEAYPALAVATAVVWDTNNGFWESSQLCSICKARPTQPNVSSLGNFQYLVDHAQEMSLPLTALPWEYLASVVDHRTPLAERDWARSYVRQNPRAIWYMAVPYDFDLMNMIMRTPGQYTAKLNGRDYTLSNIRTYGGVCSNRADFAARVGKSVGVPSLYCHWPGTPARPGHAWSAHLRVVKMWDEQIDVRCEFIGKQTAEGNWAGNATDPQSLQVMSERDFERRWWVVGQDRIGKRQAVLAMRGYHWLKNDLNLDARAMADFLERALKVNFFDEAAWLELGRMAKNKEFAEQPLPAFLKDHLASLTFTAGRFPDFVVAQYDSLLGAYPDAGDRIHHYSYALKLCTNQGRPELESRVRAMIAALQKERALTR